MNNNLKERSRLNSAFIIPIRKILSAYSRKADSISTSSDNDPHLIRQIEDTIHGRKFDRYDMTPRDLEYTGPQDGEAPSDVASRLREIATLMPEAAESILKLAEDTEYGNGDGILEKGRLYRMVRMIPDRGAGLAFIMLEGYRQEFRANQFLEVKEVPLYKRIQHKDGIF